MHKKVLLILTLIFATSCDDGDIFVQELDFPQDLNHCTGSSDLIIYTIKNTPYESLSLKLPLSNEDYLVNEGNYTTNLSTTNTFNYRTYSGNPENIFCNSLPPTSPEITSDSEATNGNTNFTTTLVEDDNDGIPAHLEDDNTDGDNDPSTNPTDTDGDGVPNYLDSDDDGDNVPTTNEDPDPNSDGDLSDALDTDLDGTPDYLDDDDDNDGTITRYEDTNMDLNPTNDISNPSLGPDYLNSTVTTGTAIDTYQDHTKTQNFTCTIVIENMVLINNSNNETIINEEFPFGTINSTISNYTYSVDFN
ncbi:MAG: hypothetical protein ACPGU9_01195 [Flavobacteriaceae bacterium]